MFSHSSSLNFSHSNFLLLAVLKETKHLAENVHVFLYSHFQNLYLLGQDSYLFLNKYLRQHSLLCLLITFLQFLYLTNILFYYLSFS